MLAIITDTESLLIDSIEKEISFGFNENDTKDVARDNLSFTTKCKIVDESQLTIYQMIDILYGYLTEENRIKNANAEFDVARQKELEKRGIL